MTETLTASRPQRPHGAGGAPGGLIIASPPAPLQWSAAGPRNAPDGFRWGSLCSGYGGLDMATTEVFGGSVAWHCQYDPDDRNQYAARILARHLPDVPNHGDITAVDFNDVEPVDGLAMGFPCQDLSLAGKHAGIADGTRSGLWLHCARAIEILKPRLVVIENVRGILSAKAHCDLESCTWCVGDDGSQSALRALGAVLGDLARLGIDAEWAGVRAEEVGAPHERFREFILGVRRPAADADDEGAQRAGQAGRSAQRHASGADREPADAASEGRPRPGVRGLSPVGRDETPQDADGTTRDQRRVAAPGQEEAGQARPDARRRGRTPASGRSGSPAPAAHTDGDTVRTEPVDEPRSGRPAIAGHPRPQAPADTDGRGLTGHQERDGEPLDDQPEGLDLLDPDGHRARREGEEPACPTCGCAEHMHDAGGFCAGCSHCTDPGLGRPVCDDDCRVCDRPETAAAADAQGDGRQERQPEPARRPGRPDARERGLPDPADADSIGRGPEQHGIQPGEPDIEWGDYEPAIRRWEAVLGRCAPRPTDDRGRLSPVFVEWMMGLPLGHVTGVPGLPRSAQLKALGNGVVPPQAAAALRLLWARFLDTAA